MTADQGGTKSAAVRVGFVVRTFTFGGSEVETMEIVKGADPSLLTFSGVAITYPMPLPQREPPADGTFPPLFMAAHPSVQAGDPRVHTCANTSAAVKAIMSASDVVVTWGEPQLFQYLPPGPLPPLVVSSKDSADWARHFSAANSLLTRWYVANSSLAAGVFPAPVRAGVRIIHNGFNPSRVIASVSRQEQRRQWGLTNSDKIVGYLGRIESYKGVSQIVEAVALLPPEWKAVFVGVSPNSRYVASLIDHCEHRLVGRYRLLEWTHDVGSTMHAFDVFCHPSEHEGFSNSLAEAWLAGVPTVYTAGTGAIPDLGDLGVPVSAGADAAEIRGAILCAYSDKALVAQAKAIIESGFLSEHMVARWTRFLREVAFAPRIPRALFLTPADVVEQFSFPLKDLIARPDLDVCAVVIEADANGIHSSYDRELYREYACPVFRVRRAPDVDEIYQRTRPDCVIAPRGPGAQRLLAGLKIPVLPAEERQTLPSQSAPIGLWI